MKKRGLSGVVTTIMLILLVLMAIIIIWGVVKPVVKEKAEQIDISLFSENIEIKEAKLNNIITIQVTVYRGSKKSELTALRFIFQDKNKNRYVKEITNNLPDELETKTYDFSGISDNFLELKKISVVPVFKKVFGIENEKEVNLAVIPVFGLISWWRFENNANDERGINNGTAMSGAYQTAEGFRFGESGVNYVEVPSNPSLDITDQITLSAWVKKHYYSNNHLKIIVKPSAIPNVNPWELYALDFKNGTEDYPCFLISNGINTSQGGLHNSTCGSVLPEEKWFHIAGTYNGSEMRLYVNGLLNSSLMGLYIQMGVNTSTPLMIGGRIGENGINPKYGLNATINNVIIFNRSLSHSEIQAIYNNQKK